MFIRFFKSNSPRAYLFLPLFALIFWGFAFLEPSVVPVKHAMPLYELVASWLIGFPALAALVSCLWVIGTAFLLNWIATENEVFTKQSYLPALFYVLLMGNNNAMLCFHPLIPANFFLLLGLHRMLISYRKDQGFSNAFDTGLLISISSLFYFPYVIFFPLIGVGFILLRPFNWREWFISFLGVMVPYLFAISGYFWRGTLDYLWYDKMFYPVIREKLQVVLPESFYFIMILGWFLLIVALGSVVMGIGSGPQKAKKSMTFMLWMFLFGALSVFLAPEISTKYFATLAIPASLIFSYYFLHMRKEWVGEIVFLLLAGGILFNLVHHYF